MKRIFEDKKWTITCPCGKVFPAFAETGTVLARGNGVYREWTCPDCGQGFQEEVKPVITLES